MRQTARASPTARVAVVLAVGATPSGQASQGTEVSFYGLQLKLLNYAHLVHLQGEGLSTPHFDCCHFFFSSYRLSV